FFLSGRVQAEVPLSIAVFTTTEFQVSSNSDLQGARVTVYFVDGLERFETALSQDLPIQAEAAKAEAFRRIDGLNEAGIGPPKNAVMGLAKAVQYGVDRYPAIVLNERALVYGVTDLVEALNRYEAWYREHAQ
ncbi:MAG: TIGR03757 family integrating conjugative element protein, partial [Planctomycetales bacterium]|nr:TIGR03757 family integrating conjugative element protein [Planctomycetales bacterium]